jgi:hypothetical protein
LLSHCLHLHRSFEAEDAPLTAGHLCRCANEAKIGVSFCGLLLTTFPPSTLVSTFLFDVDPSSCNPLRRSTSISGDELCEQATVRLGKQATNRRASACLCLAHIMKTYRKIGVTEMDVLQK